MTGDHPVLRRAVCMKIFAIGDLHLPGGQEKPMDVFGGRWADHAERIAAGVAARVGAG